MHLGHVASALYVFSLAKSFSAKAILRIEDHDRERSKDYFRDAISQDLSWLELPFWQPPPLPGTVANSREEALYHLHQSRREQDHLVILHKLLKQDKAYYCRCSRKDIRLAAKMQRKTADHHNNSQVPYPGTCRDLGLTYIPGITGIRLRSSSGIVSYKKAFGGKKTVVLNEGLGDVLLQDRLGQLSYHFAVCCDDILQNIGLIVRGQDIEPSTPCQVNLARMIDRSFDPIYYHHPLLLGRDQIKLSKRLASQPIRDMRKSGWSPSRVFAEVLKKLGVGDESVASVEFPASLINLQRHHGL